MNEDLATDAIYKSATFLYRIRKHPTAGWKWVTNSGTNPGVSAGPRYVMGRPTTPHFNTDDDFEWNVSAPNTGDYQSYAKWRTYLLGGRIFKDLDDGAEMYEHFLSNKGTRKEFDYSEGYREDPTIRRAVDTEISDSAKAVDELVCSGHTNFSITGDTRTVPQVSTDNWRKTIGSYQQWSHSNVRVEGNRVYMDITVEAADRYNFNRGAADVTSGKPDNENGRFVELGWAKPFDSYGSITKTVSWEVGHPPTPGTTLDVGSPQRDPGGEDRADNRYSKSPSAPR
ncbi:MAG: hypothetical protein WAV90_04575 [Gordonia amarae]